MTDLAGPNVEVEVLDRVTLEPGVRRMASAHIVVDGSTDGAYGRASLEAMALGCVAVNNCDAFGAWNVLRMTGGIGHRFELASAGQLRRALRRLIALGPAALAHMGRRNREWFETAWQPARLIDRNFGPLIRAALARSRRRDNGCRGQCRCDDP